MWDQLYGFGLPRGIQQVPTSLDSAGTCVFIYLFLSTLWFWSTLLGSTGTFVMHSYPFLSSLLPNKTFFLHISCKYVLEIAIFIFKLIIKVHPQKQDLHQIKLSESANFIVKTQLTR